MMTGSRVALETLATYSSEMEGQLIVNLLRERGIAATAFASQFLPGALKSVRVVVNQDSLSLARSVLAEPVNQQWFDPLDAEDDPPQSDSITNETESTVYHPWLTRFGIRTLLLGNLFALAGVFIYWGTGGHSVDSLVSFVVSTSFIAAILARRWYLRH